MSTPSPLHGLELAGTADIVLQREADTVRASGVLGEARLRKLFDYLVERTQAGESPKEVAIAIDVFGKTLGFDVSQDALVRVYIHKLRKALEDFYATPERAGARLSIPRGEYRLKVDVRSPDPPPRAPSHGLRRAPLIVAALAGALTAVAIGLAWHFAFQPEVERVRAHPIWSGILADDRPIMIVIGDYYLIGETDDTVEVKRLLREYSVNSKSDLDRYLVEHPELASRYMDVGLRYLPVSAALALRQVMVVLAPQNRRITVSKMSDLEPSNLKSADIVYIGYLSGMGMFQDLAFSGSRFAVGDSYDEVLDKPTHHTYVSEVGRQIMGPPTPTGKEQSYRDYGLFQKLRGPGGNTILVIAGTRDEGVGQTAEAFTNAQKLNEFGRQIDFAQPAEVLLEVQAFNGTNLNGKMLLHSARETIR